jgi:predicted nucleotidyltransferase
MQSISEQIVDSIFDKLYPNQINLKSFETKKNLNPAIWYNGKLRKDVKPKLLSIAKKFIESVKLENLPVTDILVVGSCASYNWSKYSDIDLHVEVDFSKVKQIKDQDTLKNYFTSKKNEWNELHGNITINGFPVELYIQDKYEENASDGVYSLKLNYWKKQPFANDYILDKALIKQQSANLINRIDEIEQIADRLTSRSKIKILYMIANKLFDSIV